MYEKQQNCSKVFLLVAIVTALCFGGLSPLWAQRFSDPASLINAARSVENGNFSESPHYIVDSLSALIDDINDVENRPCPIEFVRIVLAPSDEEVGVERPVSTDVEPEEDSDGTAFITHPVFNDSKYERWVDYLSGNAGTAGGEAFQRALIHRRYARILKFKSFCEVQTGVSLSSLDEVAFEELREQKTFNWLVNDIFEPVTVILEPELKKFMGIATITPGPASVRYTALNMVSEQGNPSHISMDQGRPVVSRTDSCLFVGDIKGLLTVNEAIENDSLGDILGHECFHGIMFDMMGSKAPGKKFSLSKVGHDAHVVSDYSLALSEGWAELYEAWSGKDNPAFDVTEDMTRFLVGRQGAIRNNKYIQSEYQKYEHTRRTGLIKNGSQLVSNEGFAAAILYRIVKHRVIEDGFGLAVEAMYIKSPANLCDLITAMAVLAPDQRTSDIILKVFLFGSKFATASSEARRLYEDYYQTRLAWLHGKNSKLADEDVEDLSQVSKDASNAYHGFVKSLLPSLLSGEIAIDSAVGAELWFDVSTTGRKRMRRNLNTVTLADLITMGLTEKGASQILSIRDSIGGVASVDDLRTLDEDDLQIIELGFATSLH